MPDKYISPIRQEIEKRKKQQSSSSKPLAVSSAYVSPIRQEINKRREEAKQARAMSPSEQGIRAAAKKTESALNKAGKSLLPASSNPATQSKASRIEAKMNSMFESPSNPAAKPTFTGSAKFAQDHPTFTKIMTTLTDPIHSFLDDTKPGQFLSAISESGADMATGGASAQGRQKNATTGNGVADTIAHLIGGAAGLVANPGGAPSLGNAMGKSSAAAEYGLNKAGVLAQNAQKTLQETGKMTPLMKATSKLVNAGYTTKTAQTIARGTGGALPIVASQKINEFPNKSAGGIASDIAGESLLFGLGDGALSAVGKGLAKTGLPGKIMGALKPKETPSLTSTLPHTINSEPIKPLDERLSFGTSTQQKARGINAQSLISSAKENAVIQKPITERLSFGQVNSPKLRQLVQSPEPKPINQEVNKPGEYTVYRRDNADANLNPEAKPHGLYVSWVKDKNTFETPFEHVGNSDFHGKVTPKNPLIAKEVVIQHKRFGTGRSGAVSAGVSALKDLVPEQRFNELIKMNKNQVTDVLKHEFPGHDYTKYGDSYELLEAYGSMLARKKGHDAIVLEDLEDPSFSEIAVLKNDILKLDNKNSVKPEATMPPKVEKPNYIQLREAAMKLKNQNNKVQAPLKRKEIATNPMNSMNATEYTPNKLQEAIRRPKLEPTIPEASQMKGDLFTNLFGNQGVGASALKSTKQIRKGPLTTEGQIVKNGIKNDKQGIKEAVNAQARATYQNFVDRLSPLKTISNKTYDTAMDASRANNIANTIIHDKFVTPEGKVVGSGLKEIFNKVARGQDKQFVDYLTLRHALTRMQRGERVYAEQLGMTPEKVKERIQMYNERHPGFAAIAKEWDGFHANMLKNYGVDEGLISPELYKALREKNPNYSPMRRQFSRSEKPGKSFLAKTTSASFSGQKAPIKEVSPTGSVRNIIDPRKSTIESVGAWANVAMRNRVMQSMVDAIKRNPEAFNGIAEIVQKPKNATDLRKVLIDGGEDDFVEALNGDFVNLFKTTKVDGENIVRAMVKGDPVYLQVHDPEVVKTLINMGPQASNLLIDVFSSLSNLTKRGATGALAPVFAVKGATMDLVQSAIQAKNPVQQAAYTVHAIFSGIGDKLNIPGLKNMAEEFRLAGGEYSAALKGDKPLNKKISDMTRYPLLSPKSVAKGLGNTVKMPFKALESIGNIAENAPRMAAYKGELKRLGGEKTPDNVRQAMSAAREITTNFSRKGAVSNDIEAFVPYSNAAVQGTYRVMRAFKDNPIRTTAAVATLAVVPKMMEFMQFHDDPDYNNLPARERSRFLIVHKNEDGTFVKIPMEPAYNSIGYITTEALRKYMDNNPNAFKGAADALANAWTPPLVTGALQGVTQDGGLEKSIAGTINSTVMAPFVATTANQSFTGAPIVSKAVADRSPQYQYDERTSSIAKKLGQYTGMSPMKVDYLIRAYGGDPARLLLPLTSDIGQGNTRNTVLRNFIVDPAYTNTMTNDFYTAKDKLSRAYRDNQEVGVPLPDWYDDKLRKSLTSTAKHSVSHKLSNLSDQKKKLNADTSLSPTEKAAKLKEIQQETNQIYLDINSKLLEKGIIK